MAQDASSLRSLLAREVRSLLGEPLRVRRGNTLRTFPTSRGGTLTLVGEDLQQDRRR